MGSFRRWDSGPPRSSIASKARRISFLPAATCCLPTGASSASASCPPWPYREILPLELVLEAHYHGDTVLCSFGAEREFLLVYLEGLSAPSRDRLRDAFGNKLVELSQADAAIYAANSFQIEHEGRLFLFMPQGVSQELRRAVRERGVEVVTVDVSEFLAKGGGSIKCMILDLGPGAEQPLSDEAATFRVARSYRRLFGG